MILIFLYVWTRIDRPIKVREESVTNSGAKIYCGITKKLSKPPAELLRDKRTESLASPYTSGQKHAKLYRFSLHCKKHHKFLQKYTINICRYVLLFTVFTFFFLFGFLSTFDNFEFYQP